jgi:NTE family protein
VSHSRTNSRKRVGLALGGGAARGLAHVGVILTLEREGIPIDCIAGTSVGSLVGAAWAAGVGGEGLLEIALEVGWRHFARPVWPRNGFLSFEKLESFLTSRISDVTFADLEIPYAAVTADLLSGEEVVLQEGRVAPAVRASCSVPGIAVPMELNGRVLIDGGVVNNLPISVVQDLGADVVIAVGLASAAGELPKGPLRIGLAAIEYLLINAGDDPATADVFIPIPLRGLGSLVRMSRRHRFIAMGRQAAEEAVPAIRAALL